MDKEKVLDYVMNSPGNSNRAVLSGMLDESSGGSSMDFLIVHDNNGALDKTWEEIYNAFPYVILERNDTAAVSTTSKLLIAWVGTFNGSDGIVYSVTFSHWQDNAFYGIHYSEGYPTYNNY